MKNPFKFGTVVEDDFFTDRVREVKYVRQIMESDNHLILLSPRRFGKTSLITKAVKQTDRPVIMINIQSVTSTTELLALLLKRIFKLFPLEKIKHQILNFRFIPILSVNPMTEGMDISFQPDVKADILLEDVFSLMEKLGEKEKMLVIFDEFQEITGLEKNLDKKLRSIMQMQKRVNYVFLGSQESMMEEIFEKKKSPFYHFGILMRLDRIPYADFFSYIKERLMPLCETECESVAKKILDFTNCHPYYSQQLAFQVWNMLECGLSAQDVVAQAVEELTQLHDFDYERLWMTMNKTDKRVLILLAQKKGSPLESGQNMATSTAFSALKRLSRQGYVIKNIRYEIDDPFFVRWIQNHTV